MFDSTSREEHFHEKMSSLAGLRRSCSVFRRSTEFGHFWLPRSTFQFDFLNVQVNFQKLLGQFPGGAHWEPCVKIGVFYLFWPARGTGSCFAGRHFKIRDFS